MRFAPPADRCEVVPAPRREPVWENGHWEWRGRRYASEATSIARARLRAQLGLVFFLLRAIGFELLAVRVERLLVCRELVALGVLTRRLSDEREREQRERRETPNSHGPLPGNLQRDATTTAALVAM